MFKSKKMRMSRKIWLIMLATISIVMLVFFAVNVTLLSKVKENFLYEQLQDAAYVKRNNIEAELDEEFFVPHFLVIFNEDKINIEADVFTRMLYLNDKDDKKYILNGIIDELSANNWETTTGKISFDDKIIYYFLVSDYTSEFGDMTHMVFFTEKSESSREIIFFAVAFISLLIFSYIISKIVARIISKPLLDLEGFADEVANRNWNAEIPKTDTEEISSLANSLEQMKLQLKEAEEKDRKFLQRASHDLKTPVMVIKGYTQAMIDKVGITSHKEALQVIKAETDRLEHRVQQLLRLNTLHHLLGGQEKEVLCIDRMLKSIVKRCETVNPKIVIESDIEEAEIRGNQETLMVAFENLMDNQIRFARTKISLSLKKHEKGLEIIFSNDGDSFTIEPSKLFEYYQKADDGNFGLGLAIVKQVINGHGGSIYAENLEKGVAFNIVIPNHL